ncbi:hypothetical protein PITCH_A720029 [uncultured Desulfobacterium sp.]|uniref:Uncharacterized protein n=1 Tax=uncultured Desulfobacterium sp. TaxID=201089 RepID=A0A445N1V7_9BACT|nr:hypothetical protein PITCH_A720029 [uncultured Desulfobacterium sp.]
MDIKSHTELSILRAEKQLAELDSKRNELINRIKELRESLPKQRPPSHDAGD